MADFDRVFELRDEVFGDDNDEPIFGGAEFFATSLDHGADDERLDQLREDERDDADGLGMWAPGVIKPEPLASLRRMRRAEFSRATFEQAGGRPFEPGTAHLRPPPLPTCNRR